MVGTNIYEWVLTAAIGSLVCRQPRMLTLLGIIDDIDTHGQSSKTKVRQTTTGCVENTAGETPSLVP